MEYPKNEYPAAAAERAEQRKAERNLADFYFQQHRDGCQACDGHSANDIKDGKSGCIEGTKLALKYWTKL